MSPSQLSRRAFLAATTTTALAAGFPLRANEARVVPRKLSPNEKLNVAAVGAGGQGLTDIMNCRKENVVALCDVDWDRAAEAFYRLPDAKKYRDYRKMLEEMPGIDAITVSTPDFMHAAVAAQAMRMGKHVYVQKPLAQSPWEARLLRRIAQETGVATQMGNQGHSSDGVREFCELFWSGALGEVREAHAWTDRPGGRWHRDPAGLARGGTPPKALDWELWLGNGPRRPYSDLLHPDKWRVWWDYGCGALGDMGCHILDGAYWALKLGEAPTFSVEVILAEGQNDDQFPTSSVLKFSFPERAGLPPVDLYWYDGGKLPQRPKGLPASARLGDKDGGSFLLGSEGTLTIGSYGNSPQARSNTGREIARKAAATLPRVEGSHYEDWIAACKGGPAACSNFDYAAPFAEMILIGNIALRTDSQVTCDRAKGAITDNPRAAALLQRDYHPGWAPKLAP